MRKHAIVAGTGFEGRASIIQIHCKIGMKAILKRDPTNEYDSNAISVFLEIPVLFGLLGKSIKQIGFIKANTAKSLAKKMDEGVEIKAHVVSYHAPIMKEHPKVSLEITDEI